MNPRENTKASANFEKAVTVYTQRTLSALGDGTHLTPAERIGAAHLGSSVEQTTIAYHTLMTQRGIVRALGAIAVVLLVMLWRVW